MAGIIFVPAEKAQDVRWMGGGDRHKIITMTKCGKMKFRTHSFMRSIAYRQNRLVNRKTAIVVKIDVSSRRGIK